MKTVQSEAPVAVLEDEKEGEDGIEDDYEEEDSDVDVGYEDDDGEEEDDEDEDDEGLEEVRRRKSTVLEHENNIGIAEIANAKIVAARLSQQVKKLERKLERMRKSMHEDDDECDDDDDEEDGDNNDDDDDDDDDDDVQEGEDGEGDKRRGGGEGGEGGNKETPEDDRVHTKKAYIAKLEERLQEQRSSMRRLKIRRRSSASTLMTEVNELSDMFNIDGFASYFDTKKSERKMPGELRFDRSEDGHKYAWERALARCCFVSLWDGVRLLAFLVLAQLTLTPPPPPPSPPVQLDMHSPGAIRAARSAATKEDAYHRKRVYAMAEAKAKQQARADPFIKEFLSTQMFAKFIADRTFPSKGNGRAADGVMHDTGGIDFRIVFFDACLDAIRVEKRHTSEMDGTDFSLRKPSPMSRADNR